MVDMVHMGVTCVIATGVMREEYHKWKCIPQEEHNWNRWKSHFNDAFNKLKELNAITADFLGYGTQNFNKHNFVDDVTAALINLLSPAISKMDAITTFMQSNKQFSRAITNLTKEIEKLLTIIEWLTSGSATQQNKSWSLGKLHNYCWTHNFVLSYNHNSKTCDNKAPRHKDEATKNTTMGGNMTNQPLSKWWGEPAGVNDSKPKLLNYLDLTNTPGCANSFMTNNTALLDSTALLLLLHKHATATRAVMQQAPKLRTILNGQHMSTTKTLQLPLKNLL